MRLLTSGVAGILLAILGCGQTLADNAVLVAEGVLVNTDPTAVPTTPNGVQNANYVSSGNFAVTSPSYVDKATFVFSFGSQTSVAAATLKLPIDQIYPQNNSAPIGARDAFGLTEVQFDVTGAVNAALNSGQYVGFRVASALDPSAVAERIPAYTGVKFLTKRAVLEFAPGAAPATNPEVSSFDGYTLEVPSINVSTMGEVYAQFRLVDANQQVFRLINAVVKDPATASSSTTVSGIQLFDCAAFSGPNSNTIAAITSASYSLNSGILDIPNSIFQSKQFSVRMEFIEGSDPMLFELLNFESISTSAGEAVDSDITDSLSVEPTQDFIPACHGWVLIGDSIRNRLVERNLITGETGKIYPFNTIPDQLTLDEARGLVFFTVHPESSRLYKLDLTTGKVSYNAVRQTLFGLDATSHEYSWALRDLAIGADGNVFSLMIDRVLVNPESQIPYTETGKWLGLMDANANFLVDSIPLLEPIRVE